MPRIVRRTAAEMAADAIRADVASGRWRDRVPGSRLLAAETGVSQPTVTLALAQLAREGLLEHTGSRRAYRIVGQPDGGQPLSDAAPLHTRRAVFVSHLELLELPETTRRVVELSRHRLEEDGWETLWRTVDFAHAKAPHRSWDSLIPHGPDVTIIAIFGRPPIAAWAARHRTRIVFLGGIRPEPPVPVIAVRSSEMVGVAYERLVGLGHRHIVLPLCDRPSAFADSIKDAVRCRLEDAGIAYVASYHTPESPYLTPEVTWSLIEAAFTRSRPTALVFLDWRELVTAFCLLSRRGLKVPEDVSLVLLNEQPDATWFLPKLARFRFPVTRLTSALVACLNGRDGAAASASPAADFEDGDSLRAPADA